MFWSPSAEGYTFAVGPQNMEELRVMPFYSVMSRQIFFIWTRLLIFFCVSASPRDAQSVSDPAKIFLTSHFSYLLFSNPPHETKIGTANMWEITSCKTPGAIIMIGQSETGRSRQLIFILLFSIRCEALLCCVPALANVLKCWAKTILLSQTSMFLLFFIQF